MGRGLSGVIHLSSQEHSHWEAPRTLGGLAWVEDENWGGPGEVEGPGLANWFD